MFFSVLDGMKLEATFNDKTNNSSTDNDDNFYIFHLIEAIPECSGFIGFTYVRFFPLVFNLT